MTDIPDWKTTLREAAVRMADGDPEREARLVRLGTAIVKKEMSWVSVAQHRASIRQEIASLERLHPRRFADRLDQLSVLFKVRAARSRSRLKALTSGLGKLDGPAAIERQALLIAAAATQLQIAAANQRHLSALKAAINAERRVKAEILRLVDAIIVDT